MITAGAGFGLFQTPNNRALLAGVPRHRAAAAGGMQATTRVYGQSFGTALVAIAFTLGGEWGFMLGIGVSVVCAKIGRASCRGWGWLSRGQGAGERHRARRRARGWMGI